MSAVQDGGAKLRTTLIVIGVFATLALATLYLCGFDQAEKKLFHLELGKGLVQILVVVVLGSLVSLLIQDQQRRLSASAQAQVRTEQYAERLDLFRADKIRRLVGVTNALRLAPVLIDAHRSAKTYNQQMRKIVDARLELRLIRHEIDAIGPASDSVSREWPAVRGALREMEQYLEWVESDFRKNSKELSELQLKAEQDRSLQLHVWKRIQSLPSVTDLLQEVDSVDSPTRYAGEYLRPYQTALTHLIKSSVTGPANS